MDSIEQLRADFRRDGVIKVAGALSPTTLRMAELAYRWSLEHPGPGAARLPANGDGTFYQDLANPTALDIYRPLVEQTEVGQLMLRLLGQDPIWFMYEQVFLKENGKTRRTPWHQDTPYLPVEGDDLAVLWMSFERIDAANALEFIRGSQHGPIYDGSRFDPADDTAPLYGTGEYPLLPDIEADRTEWDIVSWSTEPGDVLIFHPSVLHGGAPTDGNLRRRTLSLRFFGADARVANRPGSVRVENEPETLQEGIHPLTRMRGRAAGTPFRHPAFPEISTRPH